MVDKAENRISNGKLIGTFQPYRSICFIGTPSPTRYSRPSYQPGPPEASSPLISVPPIGGT